MGRVFLVNPPSTEVVKTPLLSFCHLAAALRSRGHEVALIDASAPFAPKDPAELRERIAAFAPDLVGLHLKTLHIQGGYALARELASHFPLVAGGPHATVCPDEPLRHGFTFVVRGEGEWTLCQLLDAQGGRGRLEQVPSLTYRGPLGVRNNPSGGFITELDELPSPLDAVDLFDPAWYGLTQPTPPCGLLSSRGCPAACTFCCNNVTGRRFRYHSAERVATEAATLASRFATPAFSFFDDSFAVGRRRMEELCAALTAHRRAHPGTLHWTCTAHPAHLSREVMAMMQEAGCGGVDLGIESGDPEMLLRIGKGVKVERVLDVLGWARELGLHTVVNLMFGWPDETESQLRRTISFMHAAAPLAGGFNARGVVVPYPGTEIYDQHHERFGFTSWWLDEPPLVYEPFPTAWSLAEVSRAYAADAALGRNFFRHSPDMLALIQEALHEKARLTYRTVASLPSEAAAVPAAGAR